MSQSCRCWIYALAGLLLGLPAGAGTRPGRPALRVRVPDAAGMAVQRALLGARERLFRPRCRGLLADFEAGPAPRSLTEVLAGLGRTPEQHLDALRFDDGTRKLPCAAPQVLAFTHPGSDTVYICASQFQRAVRNDPAYAEIVLIHEWLHTLGLGENPPTSLEITAQVAERCGGVARRASASR
jgi:hypothetical protein